MGAHVWAPAYLRDHLLPSFRLTGWTPDWYAGFPAFQFYMVLPSLAIALLSYVIPYGTAFKLVAISGVLTLPIAAWAFGRLTRLPFPAPPLLAVAATAFLFDRSFSIYGGNIASTLAGEFAFSISLTFAMLYLGVVGRGLDTGRRRGMGRRCCWPSPGCATSSRSCSPSARAAVWLLVTCSAGPRRCPVRSPSAPTTTAGGRAATGASPTPSAAVFAAVGRWVASCGPSRAPRAGRGGWSPPGWSASPSPCGGCCRSTCARAT